MIILFKDYSIFVFLIYFPETPFDDDEDLYIKKIYISNCDDGLK